jgi:glucose/arabinose dehydrogenase
MMTQTARGPIWLLLLVLVLLAGCGSEPQPMPTPVAAQTFPDQASFEIPAGIDVNLLDVAGAAAACDGSTEATLNCVTAMGMSLIDTSINASIFSRWALPLAPFALALTGDETLQLRMRRSGDVRPNLYLVDSEGARVSVSLAAYGLDERWQTLNIPLREVRNQEGVAPRMADLQALEIVFEWADMAGTVEIEDVRFVPVWEERVATTETGQALTDALSAPDGFAIEPLAEGLLGVTQVDFTPDGDMLVSLQDGRIWWYLDDDSDGAYDLRRLYDTGYHEIVGLLYDPVDGAVWLGGRGQLYRTLDSDGDGVADVRELRLDGLPWGRHQNNGLAWNPDPDPFSGEPGNTWIYFGLGSTGDLDVGGELNATVVRFARDGQGVEALEVVSRGNRNAYMVAWGAVPEDLSRPDEVAAVWQLFASENGPDFNDAPDEVNHIRWQHHYGFPEQFGPVEPAALDGDPYSGPIYPATAHASASGLVYIDHPAWPAEYRTLYVSLFGQVFSEEVVGHTVERVAMTEIDTTTGPTYRGTPSDFVTGLDRPLPLAKDAAGNLIVGDYATGMIYRVTYLGE